MFKDLGFSSDWNEQQEWSHPSYIFKASLWKIEGLGWEQEDQVKVGGGMDQGDSYREVVRVWVDAVGRAAMICWWIDWVGWENKDSGLLRFDLVDTALIKILL